jgi:hypothetical protein
MFGGLSPAAAVLDLVRIVRMVPAIEVMRRRASLSSAVHGARALGARRIARSPAGRAALKRLIAAIDRRLPGGGNCLRRSLIEMALDGGAAREPLFAGFRTGGGPKSGHAWLESDPSGGSYDAVISI